MYQTVIYEKKQGIATMTLNRPDQLNTINTQMHDELASVLHAIKCDEDVRVVIVTGGEKCFCAGADIKEKVPKSQPRKGELRLWRELEVLDVPTIAAISGWALGGGFQLALACDLRIASETAQFGLPEVKLGSAPRSGGLQRLPRIIGITKAKEMLFLGTPIDAHEAYRLGLVNKVTPVSLLMEEAVKLATELTERPAHALRLAKKCVTQGLDLGLSAALEFDEVSIKAEMGAPEAQKYFSKRKREFSSKSAKSRI